MKKIGFIDLFIDEWHANNYPKFINDSKFKDKFQVAYAWEETPNGGRPLTKWCDEFGVIPAKSIDEIVEKSDCLIVLAPSNPEAHERLSEIPLKSGKPVYIDKPFAPDFKTAKRIVAMAEKNKTPMFSSSALRFGSGLNKIIAGLGGEKAAYASTKGGGRLFAEYAIHQIEMLVMLMGNNPKRLIQCGSSGAELMIVEYPDGRRCMANYAPGFAFQADCMNKDGKCFSDTAMNDFFSLFIDAVLEFFESGKSAVPFEQTLAVANVLETAVKALTQKDKWLEINI